MFETLEEAEAYTQIGKNLVPHGDAFHSTTNGIADLGSQAIDATLGKGSFPDLGQVLDLRYGGHYQLDVRPPTEIMNPATGAASNNILPNVEITFPETSAQTFTSSPTTQPLDLASTPGSGSISMDASMTPMDASLTPMDASPFKFDALQNVVADICKTLVTGPLGILGAVLGFLVAIFSAAIQATAQFLTDAAQSAASLASQLWKKQLEAT